MGIFHAFVSTADDDTNTDIVRPTADWDADHFSPAQVLTQWAEHEANAQTWADQPAAETRFFGDERSYAYADLRYATQIRIIAEITVPAASGAELRMQYSLGGGVWVALGPSVSIASVGLMAGAWATVALAARVENCLVRITGINGNGVADPKFRSAAVQYR